jgi:hypothetical protein
VIALKELSGNMDASAKKINAPLMTQGSRNVGAWCVVYYSPQVTNIMPDFKLLFHF